MTEVLTVGVAGAGTMGTGIAIVSTRAGFTTIVFDEKHGAAEKARNQTKAFFHKSVERGKLGADKLSSVLEKWQSAERLEDLAQCDIVIEAVFEELGVKHRLLRSLDRVCPQATIFASNTSTISITEIAGGSGRPDRVVGMHFCLPAQLMKLVEMSAGLATSETCFATTWNFCKSLGQTPVRTQDTPGFILNYFLIPFNNDAIRLVEQGVAEPSEIDKAIKEGLGYPMGPLELLDLVGMDTQKLLCDAMYGLTHESRAACPALVKRMIAAGHIGKKVGRGFHTYLDTKAFGA